MTWQCLGRLCLVHLLRPSLGMLLPGWGKKVCLFNSKEAQMGLWLNDQQNIMKLSFYQVALISVWLQHQGSNPTGFCTAPLKHHNCHKKTCTKKLMKYRDKSTCYLKKKWCFGFLHHSRIEYFKKRSEKTSELCIVLFMLKCSNIHAISKEELYPSLGITCNIGL